MSDTEQLIVRFNQAREDNDAQAISSMLAEDVEWHPPLSIRPRPFRGRERVTKALTGGTTGTILDVGSIRREVTAMVVSGNTAVVRQLMTARLLAGGEYRNDYCWFYTVSNGLIERIDEYGDTLLVARAGFVPLTPSEEAR